MDQITKNAQISEAIMIQVAAGLSVQQAFDAVLGQGAYMKLAGELYDQLKAA